MAELNLYVYAWRACVRVRVCVCSCQSESEVNSTTPNIWCRLPSFGDFSRLRNVISVCSRVRANTERGRITSESLNARSFVRSFVCNVCVLHSNGKKDRRTDDARIHWPLYVGIRFAILNLGDDSVAQLTTERMRWPLPAPIWPLENSFSSSIRVTHSLGEICQLSRRIELAKHAVFRIIPLNIGKRIMLLWVSQL